MIAIKSDPLRRARLAHLLNTGCGTWYGKADTTVTLDDNCRPAAVAAQPWNVYCKLGVRANGECCLNGLARRVVNERNASRVAEVRPVQFDFGARCRGGWLERGDEGRSTVFAAPRANKKFKEELAYLQVLRETGFAEPD